MVAYFAKLGSLPMSDMEMFQVWEYSAQADQHDHSGNGNEPSIWQAEVMECSLFTRSEYILVFYSATSFPPRDGNYSAALASGLLAILSSTVAL